MIWNIPVATTEFTAYKQHNDCQKNLCKQFASESLSQEDYVSLSWPLCESEFIMDKY